MPKKRESFFSKNEIKSDNAKNCDSEASKNEEDNADNFEQNEHKMNSKNETQFFSTNGPDFKKSKYVRKFNPAFMPHSFSKKRFCSQRPLKIQNVQFDKTMSRTPKLLSSNLGGRGFRFNMTLESRISKFKINTYKTGRLNLQKPILVGWDVV